MEEESRLTVALDKVKAEAVEADGAQQLEPLDDVLAHVLLRVVDVGRRHVILSGLHRRSAQTRLSHRRIPNSCFS